MLDNLFLVSAAKLLVAFAADTKELDLLAFGRQCIRPLARKAHDCRVERPAQAAFGGAYQQEMDPVTASSGQQSRRRAKVADRGSDIAKHLRHALGIGTRGLGHYLRTPQLRCG